MPDNEDLAAAVDEFERALPGWWWSVGSCSVSRDASCGPDRQGVDAALLVHREFDDGFHVDASGSVADSLRAVMHAAVQARAGRLADGAGGASFGPRGHASAESQQFPSVQSNSTTGTTGEQNNIETAPYGK